MAAGAQATNSATGPTLGHGKVCYLEIPVRTEADAERSAEFYRAVFGWNVRRRGDGALAFDDGVGQVSGAWKPGGAPGEPAINIYIMVDDMAATLSAVTAHGAVVRPVGAHPGEITATIRDPAGTVFGLYQESGPIARPKQR